MQLKMIMESATKLLDEITVARRVGTGIAKSVNFKAMVLGLRRELTSFQAEFEKRKNFLGQSGDELMGLLSNAITACDKVVLLTDMNRDSDPKVMVSMLFESGGISQIETMLKALFQKIS